MDNDNHTFIKNSEAINPEWLVDGLIPTGDKALIIAQPGVGKSFFTDALATCITYDKPFIGLDTVGGEVLIVDQDTSEDKTRERLSKFENHYDGERPHTLYLYSQEGYAMDDGSLATLINSYPDLTLVILDTLARVVGKADIDKTRDISNLLATFYESINNKNLTIITNHHITTKRDTSPIDFMTYSNPQSLAMNSTQIVASCDTLYIMASPDADGELKTLMVRPKDRRTTIPVKPFTTELIDADNELYFTDYQLIDIFQHLSQSAERALDVFPIGEATTFKDIVNRSDRYFGENNLREKIIPELENKGYIKYMGRTGKGGAINWTRIQ